MLLGVIFLIVWALLLFVAQVPSGAIHLLYAAGITLVARRILAGAPKFVS